MKVKLCITTTMNNNRFENQTEWELETWPSRGGVRGVTLPWKMLCRQLLHGGKSQAFGKVVRFLYTNLSMPWINNISNFRQFHQGIH